LDKVSFYLENAIDVWNLKERFFQGDLIKILELQQEIYDLKQGSPSDLNYICTRVNLGSLRLEPCKKLGKLLKKGKQESG